MGLANDLLNDCEAQIASITLVPSQGGRFEVSVDGKLVYSKLETGRHARPGEVVGLIKEIINKMGPY